MLRCHRSVEHEDMTDSDKSDIWFVTLLSSCRCRSDGFSGLWNVSDGRFDCIVVAVTDDDFIVYVLSRS